MTAWGCRTWPNRGRCRPVPRTRSPSGSTPSPLRRWSASWRPRSGSPAAWSPRSTSPSRAPTESPSTSPARRSTASTRSRSSMRCARSRASPCTGSATAPSCCTSAARSRSQPKVPLKTRDDLSMAYTPGVGGCRMALAEHPEDVGKLTVKGNSVAVVTDGSAVLGLGNLGPGAALPVMEGKAALFKRFADIDAWPICLDTQDTDEIVAVVRVAHSTRPSRPRTGPRAARGGGESRLAARPARARLAWTRGPLLRPPLRSSGGRARGALREAARRGNPVGARRGSSSPLPPARAAARLGLLGPYPRRRG